MKLWWSIKFIIRQTKVTQIILFRIDLQHFFMYSRANDERMDDWFEQNLLFIVSLSRSRLCNISIIDFELFCAIFPLLFVHIQIPIKSMKWKLRFHETLITHSFMCINEIKYKLKRIKNYVKCEWHSLGYIMIMELNISKFKRVYNWLGSLLHDFFKNKYLGLKWFKFVSFFD